MEIRVRIENGKAYLEFEFSGTDSEGMEKTVFICVRDREGREVLRFFYPLGEEEPAQGILLHPHLWNGLEDPYLYCATACFIDSKGKVCGSLQQVLALFTFEEIPGKGWYLNGKPFAVRAVKWNGLEGITREAVPIERLPEENTANILEMLYKMGANTLYLADGAVTKEFLQLCKEKGFLAIAEEEEMDTPDCSMPDCSELFFSKEYHFTDSYYYYRALWSREPFVYISMSSIKKNENGTFSLTVYSNQKKIALYVDGVLFEFRVGGQEYFFEEIPVKKYPVVLTAEAGECNTAVTIYGSSQNFHRNVTFS